jgi:hypothetical protein
MTEPARTEIITRPQAALPIVPGWPGQLVVRAAQPQEVPRPMVAPTSRRSATRTTSCPGHPAQVLAALVLYQILLAYNRIKGHNDAEVKWILDLL